MSGSGVDRFIGGQGQGVNTVGGSGADVRTGALKMARTTGGQAQELSGSGVDRFIGGQDRLKELTLDKVRGMKNTTGQSVGIILYSMYNVQLYLLYMHE